MNPEAQRVSIAEACGFTSLRYDWINGSDSIKDWMHDKGRGIPNYPADLNAMHEALRVLTDDQQLTFIRHLLGIESDTHSSLWSLSWDSAFACAIASAAELAQAFLRTLGKWDDAK